MADTDVLILNDEQKLAVEHVQGPLLIVAGAGTGKTKVIVEKIKHLITNNLAKPEQILALTFTEKAAYEMEERIDQDMPYGYFQMWIATFHSFADQILREEISHIGLNPGYTLMTQAENIIFMRRNLFSFNLKYFRPLGNPNKFLESLLQHFSRLRDEDISPQQYREWAQSYELTEEEDPEVKDKYIELAQAYETYQLLKVKEGFFDFGDLIFYLLELFRKRPSILKKYQTQFKYILVDEFQDTNISQYELIKLLCPPDKIPNLAVVGDDSQAIYKFRGASVSNIMTFMKDYSNATQITLNKNYRSHQPILDVSYKLIKHNDPDTLEAQLGISKELVAHKGKSQDSVHFKFTSTGDDEADFVAQEISRLRKKNNYSYSDFAILVRANSHAEPFINSLNRYAIPYRFLGPAVLFKQPEIKDLIAYLKILYDLQDSVSFYRVLCMDIFGIEQKDINLLLSFAKKTSLSLYDACELCMSFIEKDWYKPELEIYKSHLPLLGEKTNTSLLMLIKMIKRHLGLVKKENGAQILFYFLEDSGLLKKIAQVNSEREEKITLNITKFFNKLKSFENQHEDASLFAIVDYVQMSMDMGESPAADDSDSSSYDGVNLLTVHASKGLEFPVVFLVNLAKGRFPTYEKKEPIPIPQELIKEMLPKGDYHIEEERRLFYVGLTRAMDKIYMTASSMYGEGKRERKPSPFIVETIGEAEYSKQLNITKDEKVQLTIFDFKKPEPPVIKEQFFLKNFSFSQLESYKTCGLSYKYQYILKIPTPANAAAAFGDSIHKTLQKFYGEYIQDQTLGLHRALEIYALMWSPVGYASKAHQNKMKEEGVEMLRRFFSKFHPPVASVVSLEKLFKIKIDDDIFITGKIDRVDSDPNGNIEIIDYKTGRKPDEKELKKSFQLSIYALAAMDKGLYAKPLDQVSLTFYYLQDMDKITMKRTEEDMIQVKEEIHTIVGDIRQNEFAPKVGPWCNFCPFRMICEAWQG